MKNSLFLLFISLLFSGCAISHIHHVPESSCGDTDHIEQLTRDVDHEKPIIPVRFKNNDK